MMNYREEVLRTCGTPSSDKDRLLNCALGLAGESGEVADVVKKHFFQGHKLDKDKLINEIGDVMWYTELMMATLGVTREEVETKNVEKLRRRYPDGFTPEDSINRTKE